MISVPVNHATLARWQQELRRAAEIIGVGPIGPTGAAVLKSIADEMDDVLAPEIPRGAYSGVTVVLKSTTASKNPAMHAARLNGLFEPICGGSGAIGAWIAKRQGASAVTCEHCLRKLRRAGR